MMVHKKLTLAIAALSVAGMVALGCGDDEQGETPLTEAGPPAEVGPPGDGGGGDTSVTDGGCTFNDFVTGLITNNTTPTALPSTDLGDKCVDEQKLFPQTIF